MNKYFDLSVHQLVDFILRSGDIDDRYFNNSTMLEGIIMHQYVQSKQNETYESEVPVDGTINISNYIIRLHGRCDGVIKCEKKVIIDEIKSYIGDREKFINNNFSWHLAQAECYAYLYALKNKLDCIGIQLTYISQIDKNTTYKNFEYTFIDLKNKVESYLYEYLDFLKIIDDLKENRNQSLKELKFPFLKLRKGQKEMIEFVNKDIVNKEIGFIEAPTGIGKTVSCIYGSLLSFKDIQIDKIFYLTPKNNEFKLALSSLKLFNNSGVKITGIEILSKEKMCLSDKKKCNPENCVFARGYYDKIKKILKELLLNHLLFDEKIIKDIALKENVCPFELSLDLSNYVDYIICDYNYVFHPTAFLKRFFESPDKTYNIDLLVDEAHNLISRSRDMYSSFISNSLFSNMKKELKNIKNIDIKKNLKKLSSNFAMFKKIEFINSEEEEISELKLEKLDDEFVKNLRQMSDVYKKYSNDHPFQIYEKADEFFLESYKFLKIYDLLDENFSIYLRKKMNDFEIHLYCINASEFINNTLKKVDSATLFSATLSPLNYYTKLLTDDVYDNKLLLDSPFDTKNLNLMINDSLSIAYQDRDKSLNEVINNIKAFIDEKKGNYLIFVPSYEYLYKLKSGLNFDKEYNVIYQKKSMTNLEKSSFLEAFTENPRKTTIGIAVIGGSFSEGIDLVNDRLIGVIIIGIGLPSFDYESKILRNYYDKNNLDGFNYTYVNPAMNRVMQAVGRLIRSENDRGSVLLIDSRYLHKKYLNLFRNEWKNYKVVKNSDEIKKVLREFYKN